VVEFLKVFLIVDSYINHNYKLAHTHSPFKT
jgi:hypothetical protein